MKPYNEFYDDYDYALDRALEAVRYLTPPEQYSARAKLAFKAAVTDAWNAIRSGYTKYPLTRWRYRMYEDCYGSGFHCGLDHAMAYVLGVKPRRYSTVMETRAYMRGLLEAVQNVHGVWRSHNPPDALNKALMDGATVEELMATAEPIECPPDDDEEVL